MQFDNVIIVLVQPGSPGNLGSTARAMKNMGFRRLRLVDPPAWRDEASYREEAERMAWNALDVLEAAETWGSLDEAIRDVDLVIGTSARQARYRDPSLLPEAAAEISHQTESNRVAILFGSEKHGLTIEQLSRCQRLITIPASSDYPTLNLAQAVLIVCYQLSISGQRPTPPGTRWAPQEELSACFDHARRVLLEIGFLNPQNPEHTLEILRKIFGRSGLTMGELKTLRGMLRQIDWAARRGNPPQW
jgi:tRNA/rRNA methyltransferase